MSLYRRPIYPACVDVKATDTPGEPQKTTDESRAAWLEVISPALFVRYLDPGMIVASHSMTCCWCFSQFDTV